MSPNADQEAKAIHSGRVKLPGTDGTTFIRMIDALTAHPSHAISGGVDVSAALPLRRSRYATHADSQPTPTASEPTSVIGTRMASPNIAAAAVSTAISTIATTGV